jgi:hypothetical protein
VDYDGDGKADIISCSCPEGNVNVFPGSGNGTFRTPYLLEYMEGSPIRLGWNAMAFAYDWDADGDLDLIVRHGGCIRLMVNRGSRGKPAYEKPVVLEVDGKAIVGRFPVMVDWDGDGKDDLLVPGTRGVLMYRNLGEKGKPALQSSVVLIPSTSWETGKRRFDAPLRMPEGPSSFSAICVCDYNGDGRLDLILGDHWAEDVEGMMGPQRSDYRRYGRVWIYERLPRDDRK